MHERVQRPRCPFPAVLGGSPGGLWHAHGGHNVDYPGEEKQLANVVVVLASMKFVPQASLDSGEGGFGVTSLAVATGAFPFLFAFGVDLGKIAVAFQVSVWIASLPENGSLPWRNRGAGSAFGRFPVDRFGIVSAVGTELCDFDTDLID